MYIYISVLWAKAEALRLFQVCVCVYIYICTHVVVAGDAMDCLHVAKFEHSLGIEIKNSYAWAQLPATIALPIYSMYIYIYMYI